MEMGQTFEAGSKLIKDSSTVNNNNNNNSNNYNSNNNNNNEKIGLVAPKKCLSELFHLFSSNAS